MLYLSKDGFYTKEYGKVIKLFNSVWEFLSFWNTPLEIDGEVSFGELINILTNNYDILRAVESLTNANISLYLLDISKEYSGNDNISCIEVRRTIDIGDGYLDIIMEALGPSTRPVYNEINKEYHFKNYALSMTEWSKLKHKPLKLSRKLKVEIFDKNDLRSLGPYDCEIFLGEFLDGLFQEVCFFNSPQNREKEREILIERLENIGEDEYISFEEVMENIKGGLNGIG